MSKSRHHTLRVADNVSLHVYDLGDENADRTLVHVHGYGEHAGRYLELMESAVDDGYRVIMPDMRGHGQSGGRRGHVRRFAQFLDDLDEVLGLVATPPERTALNGHSNGGLIVLKHLTSRRTPVAAAAVTSPFLGLALEAPRLKVAAGKLMSRLLPKLNLPTEIDASDVSHVESVVAAYDSDPLNHHIINVRWFTEAMATIDEVFADASRVSLPLSVIQAGDDRIASPEATQRWAGMAPAELVDFEFAEGLFHEVLFEHDGAAWLRRILQHFNGHLG